MDPPRNVAALVRGTTPGVEEAEGGRAAEGAATPPKMDGRADESDGGTLKVLPTDACAGARKKSHDRS